MVEQLRLSRAKIKLRLLYPLLCDRNPETVGDLRLVEVAGTSGVKHQRNDTRAPDDLTDR